MGGVGGGRWEEAPELGGAPNMNTDGTASLFGVPEHMGNGQQNSDLGSQIVQHKPQQMRLCFLISQIASVFG